MFEEEISNEYDRLKQDKFGRSKRKMGKEKKRNRRRRRKEKKR